MNQLDHQQAPNLSLWRSNPIYQILAWSYLLALTASFAVIGVNVVTLIAFILIAAIFILPSPLLGLALIISLTMIFERFFTLEPLMINQIAYKLYPLDIIIGLTIVATALAYWRQRRWPRISWHWPEKLLALFILLTVIYFFRGLMDINADFYVLFSSFKNYAFYPLLYFLTISLVTNEAQLKRIIKIIINSCLVIILFIAFGFLTGEGLWTEFTPLSTEGSRLLAGTHAFYLVLGLLLTLSLMVFRKLTNNNAANAVIVVWLIGIAGSLMRHLWLGLLGAILLLWLLIPLKNKKILARLLARSALIIIAAAVIIILIVNLLPPWHSGQKILEPFFDWYQRLTSIGDVELDSSINWRLVLWQTAQKTWLDSPLIGIGLGKKIPLEFTDWQNFEEIRNIHNSPLAILIQMGLIGFLLFAGFISASAVYSWKKIRPNQALYPYYAGLISALAAILFFSLFQPYLETNLTAIFFWLFLGLIATSRNFLTPNQDYENTPNQ